MLHRESTDVRLVDDALMCGRSKKLIVAPIKRGVMHDTKRNKCGRVSGTCNFVVIEIVRKACRVPIEISIDVFCVGVEEQFVRVMPQTRIRIPFAVHAISVVLSRSYVGKICVPDMPVNFIEHNPLFFMRSDT